jgi:hypothetical protein
MTSFHTVLVKQRIVIFKPCNSTVYNVLLLIASNLRLNFYDNSCKSQRHLSCLSVATISSPHSFTIKVCMEGEKSGKENFIYTKAFSINEITSCRAHTDDKLRSQPHWSSLQLRFARITCTMTQ